MNIPIDIVTRPPMDAHRFRFATRVLFEHLSRRTTPAVCAAVTDAEGDLAVWNAGRHTYAPDAKVTRSDDLFDLASVTKVLATATLCAMLVDDGKLNLDAPVADILGRTTIDRCVTPRSLLSHCSGYPAHVHLYKRLISREEVVRAVCEMDLEYTPETRSVYSDMGFILLGAVIEHLEKRPLNEVFRDRIREPLRLHETVFCPGPSNRERIVPTENDLNWRGRLVHGEVHDENAAVMGGVAPHAGLFSTVRNVSRFVRLWLNEGRLDGKRYLPANVVRLFRSRAALVEGSTWGLGWDTVSASGSTSGQHFSPTSYGSLGFTGTSIWIDPERQIGVVLLTNRVHPTRENQGIRELRPQFHDAVMEAVGDVGM